tara:strand:+ start:8476 stop:8832 length:357 start_codon:yes stop_codon:yes gene_type:complete
MHPLLNVAIFCISYTTLSFLIGYTTYCISDDGDRAFAYGMLWPLMVIGFCIAIPIGIPMYAIVYGHKLIKRIIPSIKPGLGWTFFILLAIAIVPITYGLKHIKPNKSIRVTIPLAEKS